MKTVSLFLGILLASLSSQAESTGVHGMLLFGENTNYISHLPMFHHPHDYQFIAEVTLRESTRLPVLKKYAELKAAGVGPFTLVPEVMDLEKVISGERKKFQAAIYQGHFEKPGAVRLGEVYVAIEKQVIGQKLSTKPALENNYIVFGQNGEYYAGHVIQGKPSIDLIAKTGEVKQVIFGPSPKYCRALRCGVSKVIVVSDQSLPLVLPAMMDVPGIGDHLGLPLAGEGDGPFTKVEEIIYQEDADLK